MKKMSMKKNVIRSLICSANLWFFKDLKIPQDDTSTNQSWYNLIFTYTLFLIAHFFFFFVHLVEKKYAILIYLLAITFIIVE